MRTLDRYDPKDVNVLLRSPISVLLCIGAAAVTLAEERGVDLSFLRVGPRVFSDRPWQAFSSVLPHIGILHLLFNCYWTWRIGTLLEWTYGSWRFLALVLLVAIPSSIGEYVFFRGGVGLSGVGYGLFGAWWVLDRSPGELRATLDLRTTQLFVVWFFICIVTTVSGTMPIANFAHGMGAVAGGLVAAVLARPKLQRLGAAGTYVAVVAILAGIGLADRPELSFDRASRAHQYAYEGWVSIEAGEYERAIEMLERAAEWDPSDTGVWQNLAHSYGQLGRFAEAQRALQSKARAAAGQPLED